MPALLLALLLQAGLDRRDEFADGFSVGVHGRVLDAYGQAGADGLEYNDFFRSGYGIDLQACRLWRSGEWAYGLYSSLGFDRFGGRTYSDDLGDSLRPEALELFTIVLGPRLDYLVDEPIFSGHLLRLEVSFGGGVAWYQDVEATFTIGGSSVKGVEVFDSTVAPVFDTAFRVGISGETFAFTLGFRLRRLGGPDRGDDVSGLIDPESRFEIAFELGWEIRF